MLESSLVRKMMKVISDMRGIDGCGYVVNFRLLKFFKKKRFEVRYRKWYILKYKVWILLFCFLLNVSKWIKILFVEVYGIFDC